MRYSRTTAVFMLALVVFAFGSAINNSIFNNFLVDAFNMSAEQRGGLEIPRELPGLLVTLTIGLFFFISEPYLLAISCAVAAFGIFGVGTWSPDLFSLLIWIFIWSTGIHVQLVLIEKISLETGIGLGTGSRLGRMNGLRSLGMILGALFVIVPGKRLELGYRHMFTVAAIAMICAAALYATLGNGLQARRRRRTPFVFKKRYMRYYVLAVLFGIRKQIFITFAPWFLVRILLFRPENIARILLVSASLGIFIKPLLGRLIDVWGERNVLVMDGMIISVFCLGYVFLPHFFDGLVLDLLISLCFILDDLMFTLRTARTTWLAKIAETPEDITASMSMSVSLDHLLSMTISWIAGLAWIVLGYESVFLFCGIVAVMMTLVSAGIKTPGDNELLAAG
ncbi:hypothetical protein JW905_14345 [bacterium]|nr:hypothetical protein [candidate division CSSED10-310 bacterium]